MAGSLADRGRLRDAVAMLERRGNDVQRPAEHHLRVWYTLADLCERTGDLPRARELFDRVRKTRRVVRRCRRTSRRARLTARELPVRGDRSVAVPSTLLPPFCCTVTRRRGASHAPDVEHTQAVRRRSTVNRRTPKRPKRRVPAALNLAVVRGEVSSPPDVRVLPSETGLVQLQVTTRLETETLSMPVAVWNPPPGSRRSSPATRSWWSAGSGGASSGPAARPRRGSSSRPTSSPGPAIAAGSRPRCARSTPALEALDA